MVPDSSVVAVLGVSADAVPAGLPRQWPGCEIRLVSSGAQLARDAADADVVFLWERGDWLREHWGWSHQLRWVAAPTAGVDWLLFPELIDSDVVLTNAAGVFDEAMAGYTLALVSAICADLPATLRFQAQRQWRHRETKLLSGSRAVILGAGGIGRSIHRALNRAGLSVCCVARQHRNDGELGEIASLAELPHLLPGADFVILALPLTESTRGIIGPAELDLMNPGGWLINVGRGAVVDEPALIQALETGKIRLFKSYKPMFKDGEQKRDFLYIKDAIDMTIHLAVTKGVGGLFNLGSGLSRTWVDLANAVFGALARPPQIEFIEMPEVIRDKYQYFTQANLLRLRGAGYAAPVTSLENAVYDYVRKYLVPDKRLDPGVE